MVEDGNGTRYSLQLIGERVSEVADDVCEIKADLKSVSQRVYNLEIEAALARGQSLSDSRRRGAVQHRLAILSGLVGALALVVAILVPVLHLGA